MVTNKIRSYKKYLLKALTDPIEAKEYLNAALEDEDPEVFLILPNFTCKTNL
ncbi:Putative addiction module antidote protein (fragment) [Hyella patelloides LEGE 07179]|uniref:Addiction module antidote protein n=1 Tax=Hyella patelloides LEGE 07179 TaxID=945734 RepID=A0A563VK70_9CYAN